MGHRKEFLSTPSARRATQTGRDVFRWWMISIHALREEGDRHCPRPRLVEVISIHALREEGDFWWADVPRICIEFLSTPSARRATHRRPAPGSRGSDFYPRPPRGGRPPARSDPRSGSRISIHALREEGDPGCKMAAASSWAFLSTPSARRATMKWDGSNNDYKFLSTPSARRATSSRDFLYSSMSISIHALREEGDLAAICSTAPRFTISIHALREEGDVTLRYAVWGFFISIHALREEGDRVAGFFFCHSANFYPRPPRGGRPVFRLLWLYHSIFLSTPSARRATHPYSSWERGSNISIHALREEGDLLEGFLVLVDVDFYPRPPRGGRPQHTHAGFCA